MFAWRWFCQFFVADFRERHSDSSEGVRGGPSTIFYNVRPDEEAYDEWKPGMVLIVEFLGQEAWLSFGVTNHSVRMSLTWMLIAMADSLFRPGSSDAEEEILS